MDAVGQDGQKRRYRTVARVQAWFLGRSRDRWKQKYMALRTEAKRLKNRANDAARSRASWRALAEASEARVAALEQERAALLKGGPRGGAAAPA